MDQISIAGDKLERLALAAATLTVLTALPQSAQADCGPLEGSCVMDSGEYEVVLPQGDSAGRPAVMFLHGHGGTGRGILKNTALITGLTDRGYVVIAPSGVARSAGRGATWNFYPGWDGRDEIGYFRDLVQDVQERFGINAEQTVMAGFSAGAFMVNYLACAEPDMFGAYVPVAGGFWRPQPQACAGPVRMHHTHGWTDTVVPLEGRYLFNRKWQQGDIYAGLELWRDAMGCDTHAPARAWSEQEVRLRHWDCGPGAEITFAIHPGGHSIPKGWAEAVTAWFEKAQPTQ